MIDDTEFNEIIYSATCPKCGVEAGNYCITHTQNKTRPHKARMMLAGGIILKMLRPDIWGERSD